MNVRSTLRAPQAFVFCLFVAVALFAPALNAQSSGVPDWCRNLPRPEYKSMQRVPVKQTWFEVYRVAPGVFAIYEPHQWEETISYLILGGKRALLFDTGMGIGDLKAVTSELTALPVAVLNSHTHPDHTGSNWQFHFVYGFDSDFTRQNSHGSTGVQGEVAPGKLCGSWPAGFDPKAYVIKSWTVNERVHEGTIIDLGKRHLTVLATPGHAPDSLCLFDKENGLLFTGDTYYPGPIYIFGTGANPSAYQQSVHRLAALAPQIKLVLGAHNVPIASPSVLPKLASGFDAIQSGQVKPTSVHDGIATYQSGGISFLVTLARPVN